jgi:hypothetical protein
MTDIINLSEYSDWLHNLKQQIKTGQVKAALSVNSQMIMLYWDLGRQIAEKQGKAVTEHRHCGLDPQSPKERRKAA